MKKFMMLLALVLAPVAVAETITAKPTTTQNSPMVIPPCLGC